MAQLIPLQSLWQVRQAVQGRMSRPYSQWVVTVWPSFSSSSWKGRRRALVFPFFRGLPMRMHTRMEIAPFLWIGHFTDQAAGSACKKRAGLPPPAGFWYQLDY